MVVCILVGVLMVFRHSLRYLFEEDLSSPTSIDLAWRPLKEKKYDKKVILELHYFNPRSSKDVIREKLGGIRSKNMGIHTLLLSGSPKIGTNTYIREIAKESWGIQEIRLHSTEAINIYAFLNLIQSASPSLERVLIWNNRWNSENLNKIRNLLPKANALHLMEN